MQEVAETLADLEHTVRTLTANQLDAKIAHLTPGVFKDLKIATLSALSKLFDAANLKKWKYYHIWQDISALSLQSKPVQIV